MMGKTKAAVKNGRSQKVKVDRAQEKSIRDKYQDKPGLEELIASGDFEPPMLQGDFLHLLQLAASLKKSRTAAGVSLKDAARESGMSSADLSRLESGKGAEELKIGTLIRVAHALGQRIVIRLVPE